MDTAFKDLPSFVCVWLKKMSMPNNNNMCKYFMMYAQLTERLGETRGWQDIPEVCTFAYGVSSLGLNSHPAKKNAILVLAQAGRSISARGVPRRDVKPGIPPASISWWRLKILWCLS